MDADASLSHQFTTAPDDVRSLVQDLADARFPIREQQWPSVAAPLVSLVRGASDAAAVR